MIPRRQSTRAMKIYTRTGDAGETSLFDGTRVMKHDARVDAYGEIDELNAWLGLVRSSRVDPDLDRELDRIQRDLFAVGAELADPGKRIAARVTKASITADDVERLERLIDRFEDELEPLRRFILAGGSAPGAAPTSRARVPPANGASSRSRACRRCDAAAIRQSPLRLCSSCPRVNKRAGIPEAEGERHRVLKLVSDCRIAGLQKESLKGCPSRLSAIPRSDNPDPTGSSSDLQIHRS